MSLNFSDITGGKHMYLVGHKNVFVTKPICANKFMMYIANP